MDLLSVGHTPFDRLVQVFEAWCTGTRRIGFAQIGSGKFEPSDVPFRRLVPSSEMLLVIQRADFVVCHAGIGIIGDLMRLNKNFLVVPRAAADIDAAYQNPQVEAAEVLRLSLGVRVCINLDDFAATADHAVKHPVLLPVPPRSNTPDLIADFLQKSKLAS